MKHLHDYSSRQSDSIPEGRGWRDDYFGRYMRDIQPWQARYLNTWDAAREADDRTPGTFDVEMRLRLRVRLLQERLGGLLNDDIGLRVSRAEYRDLVMGYFHVPTGELQPGRGEALHYLGVRLFVADE